MAHLCAWPRLKWFATLGLVLIGGCSRSSLTATEPCDDEGATRICSNRCGTDGVQVCANEIWQTCVVEDRFLGCSNACGQGLAFCSKGELGRCEVPDPGPQACATGCGPGQKTCHGGVWGNCEYVDGPRSCTNDCSIVDGDGVQYCNKDAWSPCAVPLRQEHCLSACGSGKKVCDNGQWSACDAPQPLPPRLHAIIRDFTPSTNSDFQRPDIHSTVDDRNVLLPDLGADGLPVFASTGATRTISGPMSFNTFYRDTPGVNLTTTKDLQLVASTTEPGLFVYTNNSFFPIDGELFGNYSHYAHNYHFTLMVATEFVYVGGETFTFSGDDDMWVFINRRLAIDLGGVHQTETASVDLDNESYNLRIVRGNRYSLHFFFAERRAVNSNFTIRTSIADIGSCP